MTRPIVVAVILFLSSSPLTAQDDSIRVGDTHPASHSSVRIGDKESLSHDISWQLDSEAVSDQGDTASVEEHGFHPACDCRCHIGSLDCWCDCEAPCCTTEHWCPNPCDCAHGNCYLDEHGHWVCDDKWCDIWGDPGYLNDTAVRFGWWGTDTQGSPGKVGEWQGLDSSPFFDVDSLISDGVRTIDYTLTGMDNETNFARARYYGPHLGIRFRYERFIHRLDHYPLPGVALDGTPPPGPSDNVVNEDLNLGEDYAIRVQQLSAQFKGRITNNVTWKLNVWGLRKFGERQTNAVGHCFNTGLDPNSNRCHVLGQRQRIDWLTMEIEPVVQAKMGRVTLEYKRTMRGFGQDDQVVTRTYSRFDFSPGRGVIGPPFQYAFVPENFTQIDWLKAYAELNDYNQFYGMVYLGDTENKFRETRRKFNGFDLRLINRAIDDVTLTGYAKMDTTDNQYPPFRLPEESEMLPWGGPDPAVFRHPINYSATRAGIRGQWRPSYDPRRRFLMVGGYEYLYLDRDFAEYPAVDFEQANTTAHLFEIGPSMQWNPAVQTYVRYKARFTEDPLIGVRENSGEFNTGLPEQSHTVDLGGTWAPTSNFMAAAQFSLINSWHSSDIADFDEDNYPLYLTLWYAPTERVSLTGGYGYFSNWVNQDITLGFRANPDVTETIPFRYTGTAQVVSASVNYAWTPCVTLTGGYEYTRGSNFFNASESTTDPPADWSALGTFSAVHVDTQRFLAGADWQFRRNASVYFRYIYFDYEDSNASYNSGTAHFALGGLTLVR